MVTPRDGEVAHARRAIPALRPDLRRREDSTVHLVCVLPSAVSLLSLLFMLPRRLARCVPERQVPHQGIMHALCSARNRHLFSCIVSRPYHSSVQDCLEPAGPGHWPERSDSGVLCDRVPIQGVDRGEAKYVVRTLCRSIPLISLLLLKPSASAPAEVCSLSYL
jgi:hypothetical protein